MGNAKENSVFSFYKLLRLLIVIGLVGALALMLKKPGPAATILPEKVAANAQEFDAKLEQLKSASERGESGAAVAFTSDEVNSFIADASVRAAQSNSVSSEPQPEPVPAASQVGQAEAAAPAPQATVLDAAAIEQVRAAIKQTQLAFEGDEVIAQAVVQRYGQDIYVTVRGKLGVQNGYIAFTPTGFKIGGLAVPVSLVDERLKAKLAEPENRDKLKLPAFISDLRVENGQLKIVQK
ncbi:MAG: hypothetical protein JWN45_856 [Acidobacteriaceae bacterium]|nr:hypothetical protein [Acidobacteriaceae bacterium]